jgi:hypothetical protein
LSKLLSPLDLQTRRKCGGRPFFAIQEDPPISNQRVDGATLVSDSSSIVGEAGTAQLGSQSDPSEVHTSILPRSTNINRATAPTKVLTMPLTHRAILLACLAVIATPAFTPLVLHARSLSLRSASAQADTRLSGDYDYYVMLGAAPSGGFEARRRMGFAHFDGPSANGAWFKRRSGAPLYTITKVTVTGDNITMSLENGAEIRGAGER